MRFTAAAAASVLALAASANASMLSVKNTCSETLYITLTDSSQKTTGPTEFASGATYVSNIVGQGNSFALTKNTDYYSPNTPKLVLGTSTSNGVLYWSVSDVNGNPFAGESFSITSPSGNKGNVCGTATSPDSQVHGCADDNVTLTLVTC